MIGNKNDINLIMYDEMVIFRRMGLVEWYKKSVSNILIYLCY